MTPTLLSLPLELVCEIAKHVDRTDCQQLCLTCRRLGNALERQLFRVIYFSISPGNFKKSILKLQFLATTKNLQVARGPSYSTDQLHIGSLSLKDPSRFRQAPNYEDHKGVMQMREHLFAGLDALQNLRSVMWTPREVDEASEHEIIIKFIASRGHLQVLNIDLSHLRIAVPISCMQDLQEITFTERYGYSGSQAHESVRVDTYDNLAKLLASSHSDKLTTLDLAHTSIHEIFKYLNPESNPPRLKELRMTNFKFADLGSFGPLRDLTCLQLFLFSTDSSESSRVSDFWLALHCAEIYLTEIIVDDINTGFLDYLTRYSGLTKLKLAISQSQFYSKSLPSDELATVFWGDAGPLWRHAETLEEFIIDVAFECLWCFGEHNMPAFSKYTHLKRLSVCVRRADLPEGKFPGSSSDSGAGTVQNQPDSVKLLLDMVSTHMPQLSQLTIYSCHEYHEGEIGPIIALSYQEAVRKQAVNCLLAYQIPPSTAGQFPTVKIGLGTYVPKFVEYLSDETGGGDRGWRYKVIGEEKPAWSWTVRKVGGRRT